MTSLGEVDGEQSGETKSSTTSRCLPVQELHPRSNLEEETQSKWREAALISLLRTKVSLYILTTREKEEEREEKRRKRAENTAINWLLLLFLR